MPKRKAENDTAAVVGKRTKLPSKRELVKVFEKFSADGSDVIDRKLTFRALKEALPAAPPAKQEVVQLVQRIATGPELSFSEFREVVKLLNSSKSTKPPTVDTQPAAATTTTTIVKAAFVPALRRSPRNKQPRGRGSTFGTPPREVALLERPRTLSAKVIKQARVMMTRTRTSVAATHFSQLLRFVVALAMLGLLKLWATMEAGEEERVPWPTQLALFSACVGTVVFGLLAKAHSQNFQKDGSTWYTMGIAVMVPLYAWASALKLMLPEPELAVRREWLDAMQECYEAVVLHDFLELMYSMAGVRVGEPVPSKLKGREVHFTPPMSWIMPHARFDVDMMRTLEKWTLQYVFLQPLISVCRIAVLGHGDHPWLKRMLNLVFLGSTTVSMSALIGFAHSFQAEIASHEPFKKLICIKAVVAVCNYQGILLRRTLPMVQALLPPGAAEEEPFTDLVVSIEMGIVFSAAFYFAFRPGAVAPTNLNMKLRSPSSGGKAAAAKKKQD